MENEALRKIQEGISSGLDAQKVLPTIIKGSCFLEDFKGPDICRDMLAMIEVSAKYFEAHGYEGFLKDFNKTTANRVTEREVKAAISSARGFFEAKECAGKGEPVKSEEVQAEIDRQTEHEQSGKEIEKLETKYAEMPSDSVHEQILILKSRRVEIAEERQNANMIKVLETELATAPAEKAAEIKATIEYTKSPKQGGDKLSLKAQKGESILGDLKSAVLLCELGIVDARRVQNAKETAENIRQDNATAEKAYLEHGKSIAMMIEDLKSGKITDEQAADKMRAVMKDDRLQRCSGDHGSFIHAGHFETEKLAYILNGDLWEHNPEKKAQITNAEFGGDRERADKFRTNCRNYYKLDQDWNSINHGKIVKGDDKQMVDALEPELQKQFAEMADRSVSRFLGIDPKSRPTEVTEKKFDSNLERSAIEDLKAINAKQGVFPPPEFEK